MIEDGIAAMGPPNSNKQLADFHAQFDRFPYQKDAEMTEIRSNIHIDLFSLHEFDWKKINRHCSAQNVLNNIHQPPTHCHSKSFPPSCYDQVHYLAKDKVWRRFWLNVHPKKWDYWINRSLQVGFPSVLLANGHFLPGSPNIAQSTPKRCKSRLIEASAINLLPNWPQLFPCMVCVPFQTWSSITRSQTRLIEMRIHVIQSKNYCSFLFSHVVCLWHLEIDIQHYFLRSWETKIDYRRFIWSLYG